MKELVIVSGKGGCGKTSITAGLSILSKDHVIVDCDVDAPNLHMILNPSEKEKIEFFSGFCAKINSEKCISCGMCRDVCRFDAVEITDEIYTIDEFACEGCGLCEFICKSDAIEMFEPKRGDWFVSDIKNGKMIHARLGIGAENSGRLVHLIKNRARVIAKNEDKDLVIIDGPPGIGCPVIASISGADLVLIVTEPTVSGISDMKRVYDLIQSFKIPSVVVINKADLNPEMTKRIEEFANEKGIKIFGRISYDESITKAMVSGRSILKASQKTREEVEKIFDNVIESI